MADGMKIHEIKRASLLDIPAKLRELADAIEKNGQKTCVVIIGCDNGQVHVRGYGERSSGLETTGWLHRAMTAMTEGSMVQDGGYTWQPPGAS